MKRKNIDTFMLDLNPKLCKLCTNFFTILFTKKNNGEVNDFDMQI